MNKMKRKSAVIICMCVLAAFAVAGAAVFFAGRIPEGNLARMRGVIATCDSMETEALSAYKAIDGNDTDLSSRWSSENNWEDASHYIELEFPEEISVSFVILKWERRNALSYALEGSTDGVEWETIRSFDAPPEVKNQEIAFDTPARVKHLRLSVYAVSDSEEDFSNLYQNVSLYEFEVYADKPAAYCLGNAFVGYQEDGGRYLVMPKAPEGYEVTYLGADYEQVIAADGTIYDTIQDKEVTVGFLVKNSRDDADVREISQILMVPAYDGGEDTAKGSLTGEEEQRYNDCPEVVPALAEWRGGKGSFETGGAFRIIVEEGSTLWETAELFRQRYNAMVRCNVEIVSGSLQDAEAGDFYLCSAPASDGLGKEGYFCDISDVCVIKGQTDTGVRWGTVTVLQMLSRYSSLPCGQIRDYPLYEVRGFGIDVARKPVSMETLYAMMEKMSYYKMNDMGIHLNDNAILSTSGLTDTAEHAMTAYSAFRLESDVANESGQRLTSGEYAYTKDEFDEFVRTAAKYGVTVVPEIDTPAHSLSVTKLYPDYALTARAESVDQIDLSNAQAVALVQSIWNEALAEEEGAFRSAHIVNIGMDEYYGDGEQYRLYASQIANLVKKTGRTVRMWGSLSNMEGSTMPDAKGLQMNVWNTLWADPKQMYEAGYSLINMESGHLYVIPGGGYDYLDRQELYENWQPNKFYDYNSIALIPAYSPQMLGAAYMIWNDMCGTLDVGICEYDLYERFRQPLALMSAKLWGMGEYKSYEAFDRTAAALDLLMPGAGGEENRLYDETAGVEPSYEIGMRVRLGQADGLAGTKERGNDVDGTGEAKPQKDMRGAQVLAESDSVYGEWAFYAAEPQTGKVGFAREGRTYTWDYTLPAQEWVEFKIVGEPGQTTLYVNGSKVETLGNQEPFEEYATFVFPIQRIGKETGAFDGEIEWEYIHR